MGLIVEEASHGVGSQQIEAIEAVAPGSATVTVSMATLSAASAVSVS